MPKLKPNTRYPTAKEDAQISAGIAADPDNPELVFNLSDKPQNAADFFGPEKYAQVLESKIQSHPQLATVSEAQS